MAARKAAVAQTAPAAPQEGQQAIAPEAPVQAEAVAQQEGQPVQDAQDAPPRDQKAAALVIKVKNVGKHERFEPISRTALPVDKTVKITAQTEKALQAIKANIRQMNDLAGSTVLQIKE